MRLSDRLSNDQKKKLKKMGKLSQADLRYLMGINRDTYKKVNRRWRRK